MKKLVLSMVALLAIGCANPSMERGLESLQANLDTLEAELLAADIDGMLADLAAISDMAEDALADANQLNEDMVANLATIDSILVGLATAQTALENAPSKEQVAALAAQVNELGEGISMLVFIADYDYDGVMNGLDQCPDTPLSEINDVNGVGCSPSQTPTTGTTTTTTGG